ncbi:integrin alpha-M-like [Centroberyx affinis]|uniref:integrin alpha-M-like n=1 Tax=Centroberyx affinis TaxID=166261 RepID=UPI003A5C6F5D
MDWIITAALFLSVFKAAVGFNIDPVAWKSLSQPAAGFGYQVVQRGPGLLVSAPLEEYSQNKRGKIYQCSTRSCAAMTIPVPDFAVNMSLGLTMTSDPTTKKTMACGPTIPKDCKSITKYNGMCLQIDGNDGIELSMPSSLEECQIKADIAFLLDGSGSVNSRDFTTMKTFVKDLIRSLLGRDTQFAIVQFSSYPTIHYYFNNFLSSRSWEANIDNIVQQTGGTYTAAAIQRVVNNVFTTSRGSRPNVRKVLIVITDGESNGGGSIQEAASLAERQSIVRFAIGVGNAFNGLSARAELDMIASSPKPEHVFRVGNFAALEKLRESLQDRLFSIEGSQSSGDSLKMEMAQEGFSAAYVPGGGIHMAIVGALEWKGGYQGYSNSGQRTSTHEAYYMQPDSYLGYSMAIAKTQNGILTIVGAPRYDHRGIVMALSTTNQKIDPFPWQFQIGAYFGAEVCAMDVDRDSNQYTDLILISAPMFMDTDREGRVYICSLTGLKVDCRFEAPIILKGDAVEKGRFGSSLAPLPDLNVDGFNDLAIGAPLENDGQGSIYIFNGEGRGTINPTNSQRIAGSDVRPGLQFFGLSISQSSFDLSGDMLPDLAVGSKGTVLLLRSQPIVMVEAQVSFNPTKIPPSEDCSNPLRNTAQICFTMTRHSEVQTAQARINYTLTLDFTRKAPNHRASINPANGKQREETKSFILDLQQRRPCFQHNFFIEACPDDALNELSNELRFTFEGMPSSKRLRPSLAQQAQTKTYHPLGFEINCGADDNCVDNLKVDFNFTRSSEVKVGIDELLNVTVSVENTEENAYNSRVILTYPAELSYRKFTSLQGRVECNSLDSEDGLTRGKSDCTIDKPIFKSNTKALFIVSYGIDSNSQLDRKIFITANATSGNVEHSRGSELYKMKEIAVKYSIFASIESSLSYTNFSFGKNNLQKPVQHSVMVLNDLRAVNMTVVFKVPVKLGDKDIWVDPRNIQIQGCQRYKDEEPTVPDFVAQLKKNQTVDCSVARCSVFKCNKFMGKNDRDIYNISANLSSGWIEQIGLKSVKFLLISTATLEYDRDQYIFFSTGSQNNPPVRRIEAEVEVYTETDLTKEIVGGSLGGLVLLALITAGLYKAGFFKSQYKQMIENEAGEAQGLGGDGEAPAAEQ